MCVSKCHRLKRIQRYISCKESLQNVPVMDFVDDGYTGSNFDRPGFQQMMDGVRNGKIDTIIVKDLSRFGRDYIGVGEYMEQIFPLLGVRLIAINDNYDSNNYKGTTLGMDVELVGQTQCTSEIFQVSDIESAVFQALKKEFSLLDSLYGDIQKEEQALKEAHKKANCRKTLMEQELKNLKGEKMRMYEEYAAGTLPLDTYKQKKQECDRRISEVEEKIELEKGVESTRSAVPGTVRAAAEQAENFLHGTRLTAGMVSAFIENVFVHDGGRIVVRFKYEQSIQDTVKALHTS